MLQDLRYALRSLARSPGFVLLATVCLGLALALNTTTFAIFDAMLHPSLPVKDADRLFAVQVWGWRAAGDAPVWERFSLLRGTTFYDEIAFVSWARWVTVRAGNDVREEQVPRASRNLFPMLGVRPEQGRLIEPSSPDNVALVSHDEWERSLGGRPLRNLAVWVGDQEYAVIGVLPPEMTFPVGGVVIPVPLTSERSGSGLGGVTPVVRVKPGWTIDQVKEQLAALASRVRLEYGSGPMPYEFSLKSIVPDPLELEQIHFAMAGAALVVLLIACVNLASLMLVRGVVKRRELALRMALGADRVALARQMLTEGALVAALGAAVGLMLTLWALAVLRSRFPPAVAMLGVVRPHASWRVFVAGLGLATATLLIFGLWPAVRASDVDVSEPLKDTSAASTGRRSQRHSLLVVTEVALSLVLLMSAALLSRAAAERAQSALGFDRTGLLGARISLGRRYGGDTLEAISRNLLTAMGAVSGVRSVAAFGPSLGGYAISEFYDGTNGLVNRASVLSVSDRYLATVGIPVIGGRDFLPGDELHGAVIVDEDAAQALWPDGRAVGRLVKPAFAKSNEPWLRVVGLARRPRWFRSLDDPYLGSDAAFLRSQGAIYVAWQPRGKIWGWQVAIRTGRFDTGSAVALRQAIRDALGSRGRLLWVQPLFSSFDVVQRARYFLVGVFGLFSAFALTLTAIGLYGVLSYSVSQRMREFAVRLAVGAPARDIMRLVAHDGAIMVLAGTGVGAFLAMWASNLLGGWLYSVYHTDPSALLLAEAVLLGAGFAACLQPALCAMRANPIDILRAI